MNQPSGTVVVGVDDSASSAQALTWAVEEARTGQRPLTLAHAVRYPVPAWSNVSAVDPLRMLPEARARGRTTLDHAARTVRSLAPDLPIVDVLEFADARDLLVDLSRTAAIVVVGSHGRGPLRSGLLGSVGATLARHAACPALIHRPTRVGSVRHGVLAACDSTAESRDVLEFAFRQAESRRLPLTVLHCYWDPQSYAIGEYPADRTSTDLEIQRMNLSEAMAGFGEKYPGVHTDTRLVHGTPDVEVFKAAERMDLAVVGAHQQSWLRRLLFGSVSLAVIEHARVPVAIVPLGLARTAASG